MELGSDLLKESKVSSCFGGVLVCRARSDFWFTKADGGDLPTKSSNVCNLPRMEYIRLQCKHAKRKWKGWRKVKKIKITSQSHQQNIISLIMSLLSPRSSLSSSTSKNIPRVGESTEPFAGHTKHLLNSGATRVSRFFIRSPTPSSASDHVLRRSNRCDPTHPDIHSQRATALPVSCYNVPEILIGFDAA